MIAYFRILLLFLARHDDISLSFCTLFLAPAFLLFLYSVMLFLQNKSSFLFYVLFMRAAWDF